MTTQKTFRGVFQMVTLLFLGLMAPQVKASTVALLSDSNKEILYSYRNDQATCHGVQVDLDAPKPIGMAWASGMYQLKTFGVVEHRDSRGLIPEGTTFSVYATDAPTVLLGTSQPVTEANKQEITVGGAQYKMCRVTFDTPIPVDASKIYQFRASNEIRLKLVGFTEAQSAVTVLYEDWDVAVPAFAPAIELGVAVETACKTPVAAVIQATGAMTVFDSLTDALDAAQAGETVRLFADVVSAESILLDKPITVDGNGYSLSVSATPAIRVIATGSAEVDDLKIVDAAACAIEVTGVSGGQTPTALTLNSITTERSVQSALKVMAPNATIAINNSNLSGKHVVSVQSEGVTLTIDNTNLTSADTSSTESYAAILLGETATNCTVTMQGGSVVTTGDSVSYVMPEGAGNSVTLEGVDEQHNPIYSVMPWVESSPRIRFESRAWAEEVRSAASTDPTVVVMGGRLGGTTPTWTADKTFLVMNSVYVPSGVTLTIQAGTVVKFCPGTFIKIEDGGALNIVGAEGQDVILTAANDNTVGSQIVGFDETPITFGGIVIQSSAASFSENGYVQTRGFKFGNFPTLTLNNTTAFAAGGVARIPVTLNGVTREKIFSIDWVAEVDGATFTSGKLTWSKTSEGTKTIEVTFDEAFASAHDGFTIRVVAHRGCNVSSETCAVTLSQWVTLPIVTGTSESAAVVYDARGTATGKLVRGEVTLGELKGGAATQWDTTGLLDGWQTATVGTNATELLVLNDATIAIEGGRLAADTTWDNTVTHLVRNSVYVPSGKTLTITAGAIVKFGEGTFIKVEDGGKLTVVGAAGQDVIFTPANDNTVGTPVPGLGDETITYGGVWVQSGSATYSDNNYVQLRGFNYGSYPTVTLNDATLFATDGVAYLPVTLNSVTRNATFSIEWEAVVDGEVFQTGSLTWSKTGDGTKIVEIPFDRTFGEAHAAFTVRIVTHRACNVGRGEATVTLLTRETLNLATAVAESTPERYEGREGETAAIVRGEVILGEPEGESVTQWDTSALMDGWQTATVGESEAELLVLNDATIAIEGGRLTTDTTWDNTVTHLVRNSVYVPSGKTLTITAGTLVKFGEGTFIKVEDGGKLNVVGAAGQDVIFTPANDNTVGTPVPGLGDETIAYGGVWVQSGSATYTDNSYVQLRQFNYGNYPTVTLNDAVALRKNGGIYLALTLSGATRNQAFSIDWKATDDTAKQGQDYTVAFGSVTWSKSSEGTKWIYIPINTDEVAGESRTFTVSIDVARAVNVARGVATAQIDEYENAGLNGDEVVVTVGTESAAAPIQEDIAEQALFLNDVETIQYSGRWQNYPAEEATKLRVSLATDNGVTILKETTPEDTGAIALTLADWPVGFYTLLHEIENDYGEIIARMSKSFSVLDAEGYEWHAGTLTQNERWTADKVHVVYSTVYVPALYTLFVEPGAVVKFMTGAGIDISQGGAFFGDSIIFTHVNDDTIGGDVLSDGYTVAPPMDAYFLNGNFTFGDDTELRNITQKTALSGTISSDKKLSRGSVYRVSGTLTIASGATLTIPAGTVLKMESGATINVNSGATLNAEGTRAQPIIMTSIKDDSVGGDTNGDGNKTMPQPGDWVKIGVNGGTANFDFTHILYSSKKSTTGAINMNGGTVTFSNGEIAHGMYDAVGVESGHFYMTNSIIRDHLLAFRHWPKDPIVNCVIYDCGRLTQGGGQTFINCIFSNIAETWEAFGFPNSTYKNCVFWNEGGSVLTAEGKQDALTVCGANGNIWGDPLFVDPMNGDFRIVEGSPCVDAADSSVAPEVDYYGQPRITMTEQEEGAELVGQLADIGICEVMPRNVTSDIDLVPQNVRTVTNAVPGELLFVKWEVKNAGGIELEGAWRDTVSLVSNNGREIQLGVKTTSGVIAPGGSIFCSGYFAIPPISEGEWYPKVNVNSYRDIFEGALGVNNALVGDRGLTVMAESLDPSIAREGVVNGGTPSIVKLTFGAEDENRMVKFDVPAGVKVTWGFGFMPQGASQSGSMISADGGVMFRVPEGATDVYVVLESDTTVTYEMTTESTKMVITGITPNTLPSSGTTTLMITGAGFGEDCEVSLSTATDSYRVQSTAKDASGNIIATVDCSTLTAGTSYGVRVESGEKAAELDSAVTVTKAEGKGHFWARLVTPDTVRVKRSVVCRIEYGNDGTADILSPILQIVSAGEGGLSYIGDSNVRTQLQFMAVSQSAKAGVLSPGSENSVDFLLTPGQKNPLSVYTSFGKNSFVEPWMDAASYFSALSDAATRLAASGGNAERFESVFAYAEELRKFGGFSTIVGRFVDECGEPIAGMRIGFSKKDADVLFETATDADGRYSVRISETGLYDMAYGAALQFAGISSIAVSASVDLDLGLSRIDLSRKVAVIFETDGDEIRYSQATSSSDRSQSVSPLFMSSDRVVYSMLGEGLWRIEVRCGDKSAISYVDGATDLEQTVYADLRRTYEISGRISGVSAEDGLLYIQGNGVYEPFEIDDDGNYEVNGLGEGMYSIWYIDRKQEIRMMLRQVGIVGDDAKSQNINVAKQSISSFVPSSRMSLLLSSNKTVDFDDEWWWNVKEEARKVLEDSKWYLFNTKVVLPPEEYRCSENMNLYNGYVRQYNDFGSAVLSFQECLSSDNYWAFLAYTSKLFGDTMSTVFAMLESKYFNSSWMSEILDRINDWVAGDNVVFAALGNPVELATRAFSLTKKVKDVSSMKEAVDLLDDINAIYSQLCKLKTTAKMAGHTVPPVVDEALDGMSYPMKVLTLLIDCYRIKENWPNYFDHISQIRVMASAMQTANKAFSVQRKEFNRYHDCSTGEEIWEPQYTGGAPDGRYSLDPNEMSGPLGLGNPNTERFVKPGEWMTYTVYFENMTNATAAAQEVYVTNPFSEWLDWSTFEMGEVSFGNQIDLGLSGKSSGTTEKRMEGTNWIVRTELTVDKATGEAKWYLRIVDPSTATGWPVDPVAGFLPPNNPETHCGEGHLTYRIKVREDVPAGVRIDNSATIIFDYNEPIETDPAWWNRVVPSQVPMSISPEATLVDEGETIEVKVFGGDLTRPSSAQVYLSYHTAAAADLDLAKATVTGVNQTAPSRTKLAFPLTLNWATGEVGEQTIRIPVKTDKAVEDEETFTLQLANPENMALGSKQVCMVTLHDTNAKELKAAVTPYKPKPGESPVSHQVTVGRNDGAAGFVAGSGEYTAGSKLTLTAEARPGYAFVGWALKEDLENLLSTNPKYQIVVGEDGDYVAVFEPIPYVRGLTTPAEGGKVTGSGYCADGKKVTLKVSANKNFVFKGWYAASVENPQTPDEAVCVATTPSLVIDRTAKPTANSKTSTTLTDIDEDVTFFALFEGDPRLGLTMMPEGAGKVTGAGRYLPGTKVTLKATPNKGYVFAGWYQDEAFTMPCESILADYRNPSYTYVTGAADATLHACFVPAEEDQVLTLTVQNKVNDEIAETFTINGKAEFALLVDSKSLPKVSVKGLPAGMKFTATPVMEKGSKTEVEYPINTIYGTPTKPGIYTVTVSLTNSTIKKAITKTFEIEVLNFTDDLIQIADLYELDTPGVSYTVTIDGATGCTVSGLPAGMKWTAKDIVDLKTKEVTVPANSVYGVPTTPGNYTVYFTKTVDKVKHTATATFVVGPYPQLTVDIPESSDGKIGGKVTGAGAFAANKKVTLKATASKGYVFVGWYKDALFETPCDSTLLDYRNPSYTYVMGDCDTQFYARFVTKEDEADYKMGIALYPLDTLTLENDKLVYKAGEAILPIWVMVDSLTLPKVTVKGLPKGMKFDAKTFTISGMPTQPGDYVVYVEAVNASKSCVAVAEFYFTITHYDAHGLHQDEEKVLMVAAFDAGEIVLDEHFSDLLNSVSVKSFKLPSGLSYDPKTNTINGNGKLKSGSYTVTLTDKAGQVTSFTLIAELAEEDKFTYRNALSLDPEYAYGYEGIVQGANAEVLWLEVLKHDDPSHYMDCCLLDANAAQAISVKVSGLPSGLKATFEKGICEIWEGDECVDVHYTCDLWLEGKTSAAPGDYHVTVTITNSRTGQVEHVPSLIRIYPPQPIQTTWNASFSTEMVDEETGEVRNAHADVVYTIDGTSGSVTYSLTIDPSVDNPTEKPITRSGKFSLWCIGVSENLDGEVYYTYEFDHITMTTEVYAWIDINVSHEIQSLHFDYWEERLSDVYDWDFWEWVYSPW